MAYFKLEDGYQMSEEEKARLQIKFHNALTEDEVFYVKYMAVEEDRQKCDERIDDFKTKMDALYAALSTDNFDDGEIKHLFGAMCTASSIISIYHKYSGGGLLDRRLSQLNDHAENAVEWTIRRKAERGSLQNANMMHGLFLRWETDVNTEIAKWTNKEVKGRLDGAHVKKLEDDLAVIRARITTEQANKELAGHLIQDLTNFLNIFFC